MQNVEEQKIRLEQKKNKLAAEEIKLKLKERKMRTSHLIEIGTLVAKAGLDYLPVHTLCGALLSIASLLETDPSIQNEWFRIGTSKLEQEKQNKTAIILKFEQQQQDNNVCTLIRKHGLRWNKYRLEWYGEIVDINLLKHDLGTLKYMIEQI